MRYYKNCQVNWHDNPLSLFEIAGDVDLVVVTNNIFLSVILFLASADLIALVNLNSY